LTRPVDELIAIMARLREPGSGCAWCSKQDFNGVAPYTIEEAYEVADAIDRNDMHDLRDELGDLLLQVVFHARIAEEGGHFAFGDVVATINDKMRRRHPEVFGDVTHASDGARSRQWDRLKAEERAAKGTDDTSALAGITRGLPEWQRAVKLQKRAANVGFDWPDHRPVLDKIAEEIEEVRHEFDNGADEERLADEIGDVLFATANLARHAKVDVSRALRTANAKFERRFRAMEAIAASEGRELASYTLVEQEVLWVRVKGAEEG
jgi:ATP diphosphatase